MLRRAVLTTFALLLLSACASTPDIKVDSDPAVDFSQYRTYSWAYSDTPRGMNPLLYQRVRESIDRSLAARGFTPATPGDFAIGFTLGARDKVQVTDFGAYGPYYPRYGMGWRRGAYRPSNVDVHQYREGTLAIDAYDTRTRRPIWSATATQEIPSGGADQAMIDAAVDAVIAQFGAPPAK